MDPEEQELQNDYRYRSYAAVIEKALRNFESSSEWADLISSLGKLNKALQSNLRYSLLPQRLIIGKRLAQCLHPALPSGVHLKALETYEIIFKIIGTKWLAKDLFIYSSGLFPLLGHAAMAVKPALLTLYERYYLPLQRALLPSLQAFITGLLPGLEEGADVYDRTDALLLRLSLLVGQQVFYGALWGSVLVSPLVRLPASLFIVTHFDRFTPPRQQRCMLGYNNRLVMKALCLSLQDSNVLVQRNMLEILLYFFSLATCLDPTEGSIPMTREDMITVVSAASLTLLRRDMSLNRRLYGWLLGTDIKGGMIAADPDISMEEHTAFYFNTHSRELLVQALINILNQKDVEADPESVIGYLRPFRIIISLMDKPEIGPLVVGSVLLEVVRAFYSYCREMLGEESITSTGLTGNQLTSKIKENKNASEIIKTVNMLVSSMNSDFLWDYMTCHFCTCLSDLADLPLPTLQYQSASPAPSVTEISTLIIFLMDVIPLELHADIQSQFLPQMLCRMLNALCTHMTSLDLLELTQGLHACFKVLSKIQMPVAHMDMEESQTQEVEAQEESFEYVQDVDKERDEEDNDEDGGKVNGNHDNTEPEEEPKLNGDMEHETGPGEGESPFLPLRSEDSGLGISASPSELHFLPGAGLGPEEAGIVKEGEGVWRKGGSVETITQYLQDILAFITSRYLLVQVEDVRGQEEAVQPDPAALSPGLKSSFREGPQITTTQIKDKLAELFTPNKHKPRATSDPPVPDPPTERKKGRRCAGGGVDWGAGYMPRSRVEISEECRQAFTAACHLLLESTTFPLYLSGGESHGLYNDMFNHTACGRLPETFDLAPSASICEDIVCQALLHRDKAVRLEALHRFSVLWHLTRDIQSNWTMSLNRSFDRSLCVVVDCLNSPDGSVSAAAQCWLVRALSLQDVVRILEPVLLLLLHPSTQRCTIQSVKQNLTAGILKDLKSRSRSTTNGYTNAMTTSTQTDEGTLGHMILVDREALWGELEHDPETTKPPADSTGVSRSDSEATEEENEPEEEEEEDESVHTESSGVQVSTENSSSGSAPYGSSVEEGSMVNGLRRVESEHTQASDSLSSEEEEDLELEAMARSRLLKQEREKREAIDSMFRHVLLYSVAGGWPRLLHGLALLDSLLRSSAQQPLVNALSSTSLDTSSAAHLNLVSNLLQRHQQAQDGRGFYGRLLLPNASPSSPLSLLIELMVSLCLKFLRSHYPSYLTLDPGELQGNREVQVKSVGVLTRLVTQLGIVARGQGDTSTQGEAGVSPEPICKLLARCKVQQYALLTLSASMYISQRGTEKGSAMGGVDLLDEQVGLSEESLVNLGGGGGQEQYPLQMELLKLLQALIVLEYHVWPGESGLTLHSDEPRDSHASSALAREWQTAVLFQQSIKAAQYVQTQPITAQGMFVSAAARALQPQYGYAMHPHWVALLCSSLPYLGRSLGIIVAPLITQMCRNLDELVKQYDHDGGKATQSLIGRKENIAPDYPLTLLEGLTTLTHHCLLDNKKSLVACDPADVRNARNAVIEELPHMLSSMALLWGVVKREESQSRGSDYSQTARHTSTSVYFRSSKTLRQRVLEFLTPLTGQYGVQLMASVGAVWSSRRSRRRHTKNKILPVASESRLTIVDLVKSLGTLSTENILQMVKEVVKKPHQIKRDQKSTLVDIPMLQFSYAYIQSIPAQALQENMAPLLTLLRESVQLNLAPPGHFLLLGILNDFVNRLPNLDNKKDTRDMQEVTQKILEAVGGVAGSSLEQTSWLSRNLEVKNQPQVCPETEEPSDELDLDLYDSEAQASTMVSSSAPSVYSVQALVLLAEVLAPLLDMVYRSDEKEKAVPLISRLMYYVFPYLKNHSAYNMPSFGAGAQLLSNLSGYAYTKRAWRKEAFELYMDPLFFTMDVSCTPHWRSIIDHLLTHEKTMFKDLMSMQSSSLKLFPSAEQKPMLLKRQAFAMFSGELDQYHLYLPLIQERLTEALRMGQTPSVSAQMFLTFRVLVLRISPQHLTSLWPIMVTELIRIFVRLEKALLDEKEVSKLTKVVRGAMGNGPLAFPQPELDMYLSACKFLDTALAFPPEKMPLFQMYRWAFVPEVDMSCYSGPENSLLEGEQECKPHIVKVLEALHQRYGMLNGLSEESSTERLEFPLLTRRFLTSIIQLAPFLHTLCCSFQGTSPSSPPDYPVTDYPAASADQVLKRLEHITEEEFLDSMES
ncbi:protein DOP1B [Salvelinus sp. IW2-2015]|uniref:protein DOP1B n=1 Tax=Salvelinus sp. IW2-2015 TaxID=2691554 RepID=UPI0038D4FDB3